jgi:hypothetical protein
LNKDTIDINTIRGNMMSDLRIQPAIDNGDLKECDILSQPSAQLDLFEEQEQKQLTLFPLSYKDEINRKEQND